MTHGPLVLQRVLRYLRYLLARIAGADDGWMSGAPASWALEEASVRKKMRPALDTQVRLAADIEALAFDTLSVVKSLKQDPDVFQVHATLLARCLQDLRAAVACSLNGYTMQAWSVAASAFESGHAIGYIGERTERAKRWLAHSDLKSPPFSAFAAITGAYIYLELEPDVAQREILVRREYDLYQYLCMAKHVNPLAEKTRYWVKVDGKTRLLLTPFFTPKRVGEAQLGLILAARVSLLACWAFSKAHLRDFGSIESRVLDLANRTDQAIENWQSLREDH